MHLQVLANLSLTNSSITITTGFFFSSGVSMDCGAKCCGKKDLLDSVEQTTSGYNNPSRNYSLVS